MEQRRNFATFLFIFFIIFNVSNQREPVVEKLIKHAITGLNRDLDYILNHRNIVNIDCVLGVTMAKAILEDAKQKSQLYQAELDKILNKTTEILMKTYPYLEKSSNFYFAKILLNHHFWSKSIKFLTNQFNQLPTKSNKTFYQGKGKRHWTEKFTDNCMAQAINQTMDLKPKKCHLDNRCYDFITNRDLSTGYETTHKLLLLQVANKMQCNITTEFYNFYTKTFCFNIYMEAIGMDFKTASIFWGPTFDLLLEQILLCGYEGYSEFLKLKWLAVILKNQRDIGCFWIGQQTLEKREANYLGDGCIDHTTGLAAGVLSLYINYLITQI